MRLCVKGTTGLSGGRATQINHMHIASYPSTPPDKAAWLGCSLVMALSPLCQAQARDNITFGKKVQLP